MLNNSDVALCWFSKLYFVCFLPTYSIFLKLAEFGDFDRLDLLIPDYYPPEGRDLISKAAA